MAEKQQLRGLGVQEVLDSRERHGVNVITPAAKESVWKLLIGKFNDPIIKVLLVAAVLSLIVAFVDGEFAETIGIFCAILLATGVAFWFEYDAKKRFEILNVVNDDTLVKVIRDGQVSEVPRRDVVVGDVVVLESGDEVPADARLLDAVSMSVDESSLTGEPLIRKTTDPLHFKAEATYPSDTVMRGTNVVEGHGVAEVTAVGDATEYGRVAEQSTVESGEQTPLNKQLNKLSKVIGIVGTTLAVLIFVIMVVKGLLSGELMAEGWIGAAHHILSYFMISVAIMVMAIPEGLPMSITLSLAMSMRRMLRTNNLVRKMHACETMGAVTVICTDKTGTLTRNRMSVNEMVRWGDMTDEVFDELLSADSTAFLDGSDKVIGNPTEGALLLWMRSRGVDYEPLRSAAEQVDQMTFTTERKYMATLVESPVAGRRMIYVKGAPEIVRRLCADDGREAEVQELLQGFQNRAMRTLGFAAAETDAATCEEAVGQGRMSFIGIAAISDPVRDDVPAAVAECLAAGIAVKIVTGDTPSTAREIARQIGLWDDSQDGPQNEITGVEFGELTDGQLLERVGSLKIMARARPLDKQRLVRLLQQRGEVVAVTGDGTNDAPALNFAHVGLSMGSGTSVAKEASDITLLDDSFASIATAVMWGRSLYKNIQRFVLFQLTVNFVALAVVFFGTLFGGGTLPLTVTQILWVNLIMDTFAAMALASLPPNPRVMDEKPRRETDFIISRPMIRHIGIVGGVMIAALLGLLLHWGADATTYQLSVFFTVFVMMQVWNLFNAKAFGCRSACCIKPRQARVFMLIVAGIVIGQVLIVSFGGEVFRTVPLAAAHWAAIIGATSVILFGGELMRWIQRRRGGRA